MKTSLPRGVKIALIAALCFHVLGDAFAAVRDGLLFVAVADVLVFGLVVALACELRKERGRL
ncbi:hypothetical protein DMB42_11650 [Nonomuraea sp. WAC 01424]|nr:hypothetical protein DMB42_11650 [Nonomuraea sp. WAC 01424]